MRISRSPRRASRRIVLGLCGIWLAGSLVMVLVLVAASTPRSVAATAAPTPGAATSRAPAPHAGSASRGGSGSAVQRRGRSLFTQDCASCHGLDARGIPGRAPSLRGVGAAPIDFYLSTGRMPLERPGIEPERSDPAYGHADIDALTAYLTGLAPGGTPIPRVQPELGEIRRGRELFTDDCSGCHQIMGQGGSAPGLTAPRLDQATPRQIGEALRTGPYMMPRFPPAQLDAHDVDSIARYITTTIDDPPDRGGWGIGNVGPVMEGLVAILIAGGSMLLVSRLIGKRVP